MSKAARAIITENNQILLMQREKEGQTYYTLVGGRVNSNESIEQAVVREVKEETGLDVIRASLVFIEEHPKPYNEQYTFLCEVAPHKDIGLHAASEEALLNRVGINIHTPVWIELRHFPSVPFRTVQLQESIIESFKSGFPTKAKKI